jgi:hypothetical protein
MTHEEMAGSGFLAGVVAGYLLCEAVVYLLEKRVVGLVLTTLAEERAKLEEMEFRSVCQAIASQPIAREVKVTGEQ